MALSGAERQARWREKRDALAKRAEDLEAEVARLKEELAQARKKPSKRVT